MKFIISQLKNKLKTVFIPIVTAEVASVSIWIKAGGRFEDLSNMGISHFLEHLVFRGTKKRTAKQIKQEIEGVGGLINAFTSREYTCYYAKVPKKYISTAIDLLSDITINPLMKEEDIKKEKKIILEEIRMYKDMPSYYVDDILNEIMWQGHPLGRPLAGNYSSIANINRRKLVEYKDRLYHSANMVVVIAGNINNRQIRDIIQDKFAKLSPKKDERKPSRFIYKKHKPRLKHINKMTQQTHMSLGFHTSCRTHPERYALAVLSVVLGGNMSSRLFQKIREEEALAYQISTSLAKYYDCGSFNISAGIKNKKLIKAVSLILDELEKIKKTGLTEDEFRKAKEFIIGSTLINLENSTDRMLWMGAKVISNDPVLRVEEIIRNIRKVKSNEVQEVADKYLKKDNLNLSVIGPVKNDIGKIRNIINNFS